MLSSYFFQHEREMSLISSAMSTVCGEGREIGFEKEVLE